MGERDAIGRSKMLWWQLQLDLDIKQMSLIGVVLERIGVRGVGGFILQRKGGEKMAEDIEEKQFRLSCLSLAAEVVKHEANTTKSDILPLAKEMYEWVKGGDT